MRRELPVVAWTVPPMILTSLPLMPPATAESPGNPEALIAWTTRAAIVSAVSLAKKLTPTRPLPTLPVASVSVATPRAIRVVKLPTKAPEKFNRLPSNPTSIEIGTASDKA